MSSVQGTSVAAPRRPRGGQYLSFTLGAETYGVEVLKVHEIISSLPVTRVPGTPPYIAGIVNLRGAVIPIMHLRRRFGMAESAAGESCIIVVQVHHVLIGIIVDGVSDVVNIDEKDVEDVPAFGADVNTDFLLGIAKSAGHVRLLLDIDCVFSLDDTSRAAGVTRP